MKLFSIWLGLTLASFGLLGGAYHLHLSDTPRRVLVVVDSSFSMQSVWRQVPGILDDIASIPYAEFSLVSEKVKVHSWSKKPDLRQTSPFAPRNFARLKGSNRYAEITNASEVHLISNAGNDEISNFNGWIIHRLKP